MHKLKTVLPLVTLLLLTCNFASADSIYKYTGNPFTGGYPSYQMGTCPGCEIVITLDFANPLPANLALQAVALNQGSSFVPNDGSPWLRSWSFEVLSGNILAWSSTLNPVCSPIPLISGGQVLGWTIPSGPSCSNPNKDTASFALATDGTGSISQWDMSVVSNLAWGRWSVSSYDEADAIAPFRARDYFDFDSPGLSIRSQNMNDPGGWNVPEPCSLALMCTGLLGVVGAIRRKLM